MDNESLAASDRAARLVQKTPHRVTLESLRAQMWPLEGYLLREQLHRGGSD